LYIVTIYKQKKGGENKTILGKHFSTHITSKKESKENEWMERNEYTKMMLSSDTQQRGLND